MDSRHEAFKPITLPVYTHKNKSMSIRRKLHLVLYTDRALFSQAELRIVYAQPPTFQQELIFSHRGQGTMILKSFHIHRDETNNFHITAGLHHQA